MRILDKPGRSPVHSTQGMACTSHPAASLTAIDVLRAGGNALDAAIAACAVQCVVEPESTGIGGDCFALYAPGGCGTPIAFNGSGRAPAAATVEALRAQGVDTITRGSPHAVVVPCAIDAWTQLHRDHGYMPFSELLQPAIDIARDGFGLSSRVHFDFCTQREFLRRFEHAARIYLDADGKVPPVGSRITLPELADSLELIAQEGRDAFYRGDLASDMVQLLQAAGGLHTLEDFENARGEYVTPISTDFRGCTVWECPPNGQGLFALLLLNMMKQLPIDANGPGSVSRLHTEIEACRLAYRARNTYLADPACSDVPVDALLDDRYAASLNACIDTSRATIPPPLIPVGAPHEDTVYIAVVDRQRNVCSFINTLFSGFGNGMTTASGITLTNRGTGFSMDPAHANCIAPNKRPLHTIIPAMLCKDDRVDMCFGVMGGQYQAMGHMQFLTRYLDYGLDIQEAMDLPRVMADPFTGIVEVESGIDEATRAELTRMGHDIALASKPIGGSQAIAIDWASGVLTGGSDPRKDGCAIGF